MKKVKEIVSKWWFKAALAGGLGLVGWIFSPILLGVGIGVAANQLVIGWQKNTTK